MRRICWSLALIVLSGFGAAPQQRPFITAGGDATVSTTPDQAKIQFSVVTQAATAQDAANQTANQVTAVMAALRSVLGPNADLQTLSYSLNPNYSSGNQP